LVKKLVRGTEFEVANLKLLFLLRGFGVPMGTTKPSCFISPDFTLLDRFIGPIRILDDFPIFNRICVGKLVVIFKRGYLPLDLEILAVQKMTPLRAFAIDCHYSDSIVPHCPW